MIVASLLLGVASGASYMVSRLSKPEMSLLYADLDLTDSGKIVSKLEGMDIPVEIRGGGTQIYVPSGSVPRLRMEMAEAGLPRGGSIGYEIFDRSESLGTSSFVQDINHLRALEGEIARTVGAIAQVASARVHLVLPRRELFSRDRQEPSASLVLSLNGPGRLKPARVQAIQHLVASAVPGLAPEKVSIVDDRGNLLARGDNNSEMVSASNLEEMRMGYESRLSRTIEAMIEKYVGIGKVRAEVSVDMDFDRITENSEIYDPEGQVIRSTQTIEDGETSKEANADGATIANNLPNADADAGAGGSSSQSKRTEETINYEISKKTKVHVRETGEIRRLTVGVLIDGTYVTAEDGTQTYQPRAPEQLAQLKKVISSAIGIDEKRGDNLEIVNMQFVQLDNIGPLSDESSFLGLTSADIVRLIEAAIVGVIGLLILLLVIKPLVSKLLEGNKEQESEEDENAPQLEGQDLSQLTPEQQAQQLALAQGQGNPAVLGDASATGAAQITASEDTAGTSDEIDASQIQGQIKNETLKAATDIIDEDPDTAVNIVRGWLNDEDMEAA